MKNTLKPLGIAAIALAIIFSATLPLTGCSGGTTSPPGSIIPSPPPGGPTGPTGGIINIATIEGVTAPAAGATPVTEITPTAQYTGTVVWSPVHSVFQNSTVYFATITLTPINNWLLEGVPADFFTVAGANRVNNDAGSGIITAVFPTTVGTVANPAVIDISIIDGIAPISGGTPKMAINPTAQYTGTITWSPDDNPFQPLKVYTATITLTPKTGFTFSRVEADFFKVTGANTVSNKANSNIVTATFMTTSLDSYLSTLPSNTAATPYIIALKIGTDDDFRNLITILGRNRSKYVYLDLSGSTFTTIGDDAFAYNGNLTGITIPNIRKTARFT